MSLETRIKSLKKTIKMKNAWIENTPAFTLDLHIFSHPEGSVDEAEAIVLDNVDAAFQDLVATLETAIKNGRDGMSDPIVIA